MSKLNAGAKAPQIINVIIEIPQNSDPIKYEYDKELGMLCVDRFMPTSMSYPCNYGFVPETLSGDGDPIDVLVYTNFPIQAGAMIAAKPIGVLLTEDENGTDEKIIAVPAPKVDAYFADVNELEDLPRILIDKISHFFERYKDLEKGKWVKVTGTADATKAHELINKAIENNV